MEAPLYRQPSSLGSTDKISAKGAGSGAGNADVHRDTGCDEAVGYEVEKDTDGSNAQIGVRDHLFRYSGT
jgi:hypothetical protein